MKYMLMKKDFYRSPKIFKNKIIYNIGAGQPPIRKRVVNFYECL
jgi:hypothetical protein